MTGPFLLNDTTDNYERLETELVAQDLDVARVSTADLDERSARRFVGDLMEDDVVTSVPDHRILAHAPSGEAFDSTTHLAVFHRGWQAAVRAAGYEPVGRPAAPDHHNWKEQPVHKWREYGDNWDEQRQKALERDDYTCQTPGCEWTQEAHQEAFKRGLHVHHIRPASLRPAFTRPDRR